VLALIEASIHQIPEQFTDMSLVMKVSDLFMYNIYVTIANINHYLEVDALSSMLVISFDI
jgi:hypothetical protein